MRATAVDVEQAILHLERKGFRFAPRWYGFDYEIPRISDQEWAEASAVIRELKQDEMAVSDWLGQRVKAMLAECRRRAINGAR
jgi:replicative DNA helicase